MKMIDSRTFQKRIKVNETLIVPSVPTLKGCLIRRLLPGFCFFSISYPHLWMIVSQQEALTSKTLSVRDSAGVLELVKVKKMLSRAFPSSSSNTICSLASAAPAAAAAASRSLRASSIKLWRLPTNLWDCSREKPSASCAVAVSLHHCLAENVLLSGCCSRMLDRSALITAARRNKRCSQDSQRCPSSYVMHSY